MRNGIHTKSNANLSVVTSEKPGLAKLKALALKNRFESNNDTGDNIRILISLYQKLKKIAEMKTCQAVEKYRQLISAELDVIFEASEEKVLLFVQELLDGRNIESIDFTNLFSMFDQKEISLLAGRMLSIVITERFSITSVTPMLNIEKGNWYDESVLIEEWLRYKKRTVFVSEQAAKWSSKAWGTAVDNVIADRLLVKSLDKLDLGSILLEILGVSPALEREEMLTGLVKRVQGLVKNIKMGMLREFHTQAAEIIYGIHDEIIDCRLEEKISLLEEKKYHREIYQTERA